MCAGRNGLAELGQKKPTEQSEIITGVAFVVGPTKKNG